MRILCVVQRYWPARGGVETLMHHTVTELARRHEVQVLAYRLDSAEPQRLDESLRPPPAFPPFADEDAAVRQIRLSAADRLRLAPFALTTAPGTSRFAYGRARIALSSLYAGVVGRKLADAAAWADVVHAWSTDLLGAAAERAARHAGRPIVLTPFIHPGQWGVDPASARLHRRVDRIIGLLNVERDTFRQQGVAPDQIAVCGTCAPQTERPEGLDLREKHGITGPLVVFLGVRRAYKGHDILLDAAPAVIARHPGATFAFVGPGPPVERAIPGGHIVDAGEVDDRERAGWLHAADVLCLPSAHEIYPVSLLEAWSARVPAVVSDIPPLRELMERSGGGLAVGRSPGDVAVALNRVLADDALRGRLAQAGFEFWRSSGSPSAVAACLQEIYEGVVAQKPRISARHQAA